MRNPKPSASENACDCGRASLVLGRKKCGEEKLGMTGAGNQRNGEALDNRTAVTKLAIQHSEEEDARRGIEALEEKRINLHRCR